MDLGAVIGQGRATLFHGVLWLRDEPWIGDMCVMEAPGEPGVYIAVLDLDMLRMHRNNDVMGRVLFEIQRSDSDESSQNGKIVFFLSKNKNK